MAPAPLILALIACGAGDVTNAGDGGVSDTDGGGSGDGGEGGDGDGDGGISPTELCDLELPAGPDRTLAAIDDPRSAKAIYDEFFEQYLPDHDGMGWTPAPGWLTYDWVEKFHYPTPPYGPGNELLHHYFDFNPHNFERPGAAAYDKSDDNEAAFATDDATAVHRTYDPTEWQPATASTYTRTAGSDIMATQFWFRASTPDHRAYIERALELCPDCDDVFTPLSKNDLYKILEVRFVRVTDAGPELSRVFKLIGVDSSGAMEAHAHNDAWNRFGEIDGMDATAKWRLELSGALSQRYWNSETEYIRLMPVLVRASKAAALYQYYDGRFDRDVGGDDPYQRQWNPDGEGECIRDCHLQYCRVGRSIPGFGYYQTDECSCGLQYSPVANPMPASYYAAGVCEEWQDDVWDPGPSSYQCMDFE